MLDSKHDLIFMLNDVVFNSGSVGTQPTLIGSSATNNPAVTETAKPATIISLSPSINVVTTNCTNSSCTMTTQLVSVYFNKEPFRQLSVKLKTLFHVVHTIIL